MSALRKKHGWIKRLLLAFVTVLAIITGIVWAGSYYRYAVIECPVSRKSFVNFKVRSGYVYTTYDTVMRADFRIFTVSASRAMPVSKYWWMQTPITQGHVLIYPLPLWVIFVGLAIWPVLALHAWIHRGYPLGHCPACGYDLRGSTGSATCPECGEEIPRPAAQDAGA